MNSSRTFVATLLGAVAVLGCVPDRGSLEFDGAYVPSLDETTCTWDGSTGSITILQGSMNLAVAQGYPLVVKLNNTLPATAVGVGPTETASKTRNDFVIREAEFTYTCKDTEEACAGFKPPEPTIVQLLGTLKASSTNPVHLNLFTPEAAKAIREWANNVPAAILVGMTFRGDYMSGASGQTDTINFPVVVYKIAPTPCGSVCTSGPKQGQSCVVTTDCTLEATGESGPCKPMVTKILGCPSMFGLNGNDRFVCEMPVEETTPSNP